MCIRDRVSFGWVVGDGVGQTILCTERCRCQKTKSIDLYTINPLLYERRSLFWSPSWGEGRRGKRTLNLDLCIIYGKCVVDFLLVIIELFFTRSKRRGTRSEYRLEIAVFEAVGPVRPKISGTRGRPAPTILCVGKLAELIFHTV